MPLVFALCSNKSAATYETTFRELKSYNAHINPTQIMLDFELPTVEAAKSVFPSEHVQACYFHVTKSIQHNLAQHGLKKRYETDSVFANEIRELIALAFVPVVEVALTFDALVDSSKTLNRVCLLYTSPSPRDLSTSRMPSSA